MGTVATRRAASPDGMNCSAQTTPPLPPRSRSMPTTRPFFHWRSEGWGDPLHRDQAYRMAPAVTNRTPAMVKGGRVSMAKRIAR